MKNKAVLYVCTVDKLLYVTTFIKHCNMQIKLEVEYAPYDQSNTLVNTFVISYFILTNQSCPSDTRY